MGRAIAVCIGFCLGIGLLIGMLDGRPYQVLGAAEAASLYGGDEYDDYAECDGSENCTACVPRTCVAIVLGVCGQNTPGNDGCENDDGTDSFCDSFTLWSDCEYKGGVQVCGGPANRRHCTDMVDYPTCASWGVGKTGCVLGTLSTLECQNCATIP
jgi:hypothetical protein